MRIDRPFSEPELESAPMLPATRRPELAPVSTGQARRARSSPDLPPPPPSSMPGQHRQQDDDAIDLRAYFYTLLESRWLIASATFASMFLAIAYAVLSTPVYRTDTLLQVEEKSGGMPGLDEMSAMFTGATPAETEIEILRSRALVGTVVKQLALDIEVEPRRFPLVGGAVGRRWTTDGLRPPLMGFSGYAWGGERLDVQRLMVPRELENESLTLISLGQGKFRLEGPNHSFVAIGEAGQTLSEKLGSGALELFVSDLSANEGTSFSIMKRNHDEVVGDLQQSLVVREKGKKTGILQVSLDGPNPRRIAATLDALATAYLKQNVDRKSEEALRTLEFLNTQLPQLKRDLEKAEQELNVYRSGKGTVDLSLETQALLERTVEIEKGMTQIDIEGAELRQRFTDNHPKLVTMRQQIAQLKSERHALDAKLKLLPEAELHSARLMRDVKVANELYVLLLNKAQEMNVMKSGTVGNVRILDHAIIALKPVAPRKAMTAILGLILGIGLGVGLALLRKALRAGVEDPNEVERSLGLSVYASVPHSDLQEKQVRELNRGRCASLQVLAAAHQSDLAIESIRSLRTSLQFALMDSPNRIIAIGGPSPGIGKSFVSVNLAQVLAEGGKRVLLIDGDMRKGKLHQYFGGRRGAGLSEAISGAVDVNSAIIRNTIGASANLSFLGAGVIPPNPSELLMSLRFREVMKQVEDEFELVVIDCAPILAVTDGAIIGQIAGVNLLVLKSGQHPMREIEIATKRYQQNGVALKGMVFNDTAVLGGRYGSSAYTYHYKY